MSDTNDTSTLTLAELVEAATERARLLYDGTEVVHRSCGIAIAETFGRATPAYQSLRRGGITGCAGGGGRRAGRRHQPDAAAPARGRRAGGCAAPAPWRR